MVSVCPLAAKIKRGILLSTKYPLKILVADDNKLILQVMKKSLSTLGYKDVKTVENGKEAIDELNSTPYDVILMVSTKNCLVVISNNRCRICKCL